MGIFNEAIPGGFSGRVSTVMGTNWRDWDVGRVRPGFHHRCTKSMPGKIPVQDKKEV